MARIMSDFRYVTQINSEPAWVLQQVNNILCERVQGGMFTTAMYLLLDMKKNIAHIANAGHPSLLLRNNQKQVLSKAKASGPPLGILSNISYNQEEILLKNGEIVFIYTDGVTDPKNSNNAHYGVERLCDMLKTAENSLEDFIINLEKSIQQFVGNKQKFDDLTAMAFQVL
jgi:sigma-B regulation protein RsbU (phosphoserine phosphatase)